MWCDVYNDEVLQQVSVRSGLIEVVLKCGLRLVRQSASTARVQFYKHLRGGGHWLGEQEREQYRQGERQEAGAAESLVGKSSLRLYLVECANTVRNGVGAGIGTLVGKECKGAFNRSVPTAKYKAGECTCSYEWCGKAGKIRIVCVPARTKDK